MISARPRILYLTPCFPDGRSSGSHLRVRQIGRALQEIGEVHFVVAGFDGRSEERNGSQFVVDRSFPLKPTAGKTGWSRVRDALSARSINPYGHAVEPEAQTWIGGHLENFDLVWIYNLRTAGAFGRWAWPKSVIDVDDVPSMFLRSVAPNEKNIVSRVRQQFKMYVAQRRERLLSDRFTVVAVSSDEDRRYLKLPSPVHVIPNGFESSGMEPVRRVGVPPRIGFIGGLDYEPNADAVRWFVERSWSEIKRQNPGTQLRIVGRQNDWLMNLQDKDVQALGYVPDAAEEIATWSAMIVPIRQGAGTRVKIAEGLSRKVPIVTTSLGRYGYDLQSEVEILIADSAEEFGRACLKTLHDDAFAKRMADRGYQRFQNEWSWEAIRPRIWAAAEDCLRRTASRDAACTLVTP